MRKLKLLVSFAKEPYKRDDILQKSPVILRSVLIVTTPYVYVFECASVMRWWVREGESVSVSVLGSGV